ncbi:MAG: hypothetical protein EBX27_00940 [Proteobacteria bacterium]|nr:hypothetical protein [Pseudomonadota bacterium]NCX29816.1 hypothetical protein [Pseudomonadota bacterium]NCX34092.1 hypothetical protein [Pseudomonadota bacterium]
MKKLIQFIAGAKCPTCSAIDTIAINADNDIIYCVKCDFKESRPKIDDVKKQSINAINIQDYKHPKS